LAKFLPSATVGEIAGQNRIAATATEKHTLANKTGAIAIDMESHVAARIAARHRLPFAAIRVVSDAADTDLPPAALVGMKPDGGMALGAVLGSLARRPAQLPALMRTGIDAERAFRSLARVYDALGRAGVFRADLGEFLFDV
ncbi:MAG: phosphorylase, partial [Pseudomonadota bacterium]